MAVQRYVAPFTWSRESGPTLTAAAAASMLPQGTPMSVPPGFFEDGKLIRVEARGIISCVVTTPGTARFDVRVGGVIAFDSLAMPLNIVAKTNVPWVLNATLMCRGAGTGTSTATMGWGTWTSEAVLASPLPTAGGSGTFVLPFNAAPVTSSGWDNSVSNLVDAYFTQTVATGSLTCQSFSIESLN